MEKQMKLFTYMTKPFVLFVLLFALGVGQMWGDTWLFGSFQSWVAKDDSYKFSYDGDIGTYYLELNAATEYEFKIIDGDNYYSMNNANYTTTTTDQLIYTGNGNCKVTTGEAGVYVFKTWWADNNRHFSIYFPQARLAKQKYIYFDARNETNWNNENFNARFWFKYYDSGVDITSVTCNKENAVENWVYYALVPDNDYVGRIQMNRINPDYPGEGQKEVWCTANVVWAKDRSSSALNCLKEETSKADYCNDWTPQWTTYCPPMSDVDLEEDGTTLSWGGDGSSGDPYLIPTEASIKVKATNATKAVDDDNMTIYYQFKKAGTEVQAGSTTASATITASDATGTKEAVTVEAYNYYNSTTGTHLASNEIYYEVRTPYTISYNAGTGGSGSRASETKLKGVNFATPNSAVFTRTGYTQTGWATSNGGSQLCALGGNYTSDADATLYPVWTANNYTVTLDNREADEDHEGTESVSVTYDATTNLTSAIDKPEKEHYDFGGYYTSDDEGETLGTQLIDENGNWKKGVSGYTGTSGDNATWVYAGNITLYAKWTEHEYTITIAVTGSGSVNVGSSTTAKYVTASGDITATPSVGWAFKEWQFSKTGDDNDVYVSDGETYSSLTSTIRILAEHDGTLTAVFVPRYYLVGGEIMSGDDATGTGTSSGMPGWNNYDEPFNVITSSPVLATCSLTLGTDKHFYIMVRDRANGLSYGKSSETLEDNETLTFTDQDNRVMFHSNGGTEYTFKITGIDGNGRPQVSVERPYQVNVGRKRVDIDGNDHDDNTGGTAAMSKTTGGDAVSNGTWVPYGTGVTYTASPTTGYSVAWYSSSDYSGNSFSTDATFYHIATSTGNGYAKFTEKATTVTLAATNGKIQISSTDKTSTTCGITTTRSLTAVPNDGYMFSSWTKTSGDDISISSTSTNPTTLSGLGGGESSGQTVTANFALRWALKAESDGWGSASFDIDNISTVGGDAVGYVDISLAANTNYQFTITDKQESATYKSGSDAVYYMTNGNSYVWDFSTSKTYNCGITTAGAGTYRFMWNITDKTMSVIYPNFVIYRTGDKDEDSESATHTTTSAVESYAGGTINQGIEFRMKVQALDTWYTLCLPFTVSAVKVWEDDRYYDLVPFYRTGGKYYTGDYIIRTPKTASDLSIAEFGEWNDPTTSAWLPSKNTPYIIQWHDSYFTGKYISFFGATGQTIPTSMTARSAPSSDNVVNVHGNDAMTSGSVAGAYLLENDYGSNGAWLRLENTSTARTILPFECYILANSATTTKYRVLRRDMTIDDTPTGLDQIINRKSSNRKFIKNGQLFIIRDDKMYNVYGMEVQQ